MFNTSHTVTHTNGKVYRAIVSTIGGIEFVQIFTPEGRMESLGQLSELSANWTISAN